METASQTDWCGRETVGMFLYLIFVPITITDSLLQIVSVVLYSMLCDPKTIPLRMKVTDYVLIQYVALEQVPKMTRRIYVYVGLDSD